ncbi:FixH family protein [Peribacillus asahii]|uniref:FixH family protein n=1 Tax=Peribacillus asahii TaxID=228899 RepID=UPI0038066215
MRKIIVLFLTVLIVLVGCGKEEEEQLPKMLHVELEVTPELAKVNETVIFQAKVTYGDEIVTDADEVSFEIWREDEEESETILVKHSQDGVYKLEKTFKEEGTYYVYAHVTARNLHTMPKREFVIGAKN